jgi:hypothetical protein
MTKEFFTVKLFGKANMCFDLRLMNLASLYDGAGILLMTGRIGLSALWVLIEALRSGAAGFIWVTFMVIFVYKWAFLYSLL